MRILFVWSAAEFATYDVARGYCEALKRQGHEVSEYRLFNRLKYHAMALAHADPPMHRDTELVTRLASETIVVEALRANVDLVVGVCGMGMHPDGVELLNRADFPVAMIFTEAPYDDQHHKLFARGVGHPFVNERTSAREHGWGYLPAAYDPAVHKRGSGARSERVDVLIVGTGWEERQALLERVDWTGINLRILGWWTGIKEGSPLFPFYREGAVHNRVAARMYRAAKICVNQHRFHATAESLNPRAYELAACGALQISDIRRELFDVFGMTVPLYRDAAELEFQVRYLLDRSADERASIAEQQHEKLVAGKHTFDDRAAKLMLEITKSAR